MAELTRAEIEAWRKFMSDRTLGGKTADSLCDMAIASMTYQPTRPEPAAELVEALERYLKVGQREPFDMGDQREFSAALADLKASLAAYRQKGGGRG